MIQRIQSLYLLLATICVFLCYIFSFAQIHEPDAIYIFDINGIIINNQNIIKVPYNIIIPTLGIFSFLTVFFYKNRSNQMRINRLNYVLHTALVVFIYFSVENTVTYELKSETAKISYGIGFFLPVASIAFLILANRAIKRDEELIKSIDRLRR